jgi:CheY-like chemotaxis protein
LKASKTKRRILQILTNDDQIKQFVTERREYAEFRMVSTLQEAMELLFAGEKPSGEKASAENTPAEANDEAEVLEDIADQVESQGTILNADNSKAEDGMLLRFDKDMRKQMSTEALRELIRNLRIGAVDDDGIILELIKNIFETVGASVKTYLSGTEFLAEPKKALFDLVFMDLVMPGVDGFTILQQLQAIHYQTPVVALSALSKQEMVIKAFQMGVKSYLFKPINPEEVFKKTLEVLKPNF